MFQNSYFVDKTTDTFADTLLAYGLASLLDRLLFDNVSEETVRIRDAGSAFIVALDQPIEEGFEQVDWFCDLPFIETQSTKPPEDWMGQIINYNRERERNSEFFEARKQVSREALRPGSTIDEYPELAQLEALKPRTDWQVITQINRMAGINAYKKVLEAWFDCRTCFPELIRLLLNLFAVMPNDVNKAMSEWKALKKERGLRTKDTVTPVQILNPAMGKGLNRAKADGANRLDNPKSFWLLEFLKFWGMRVAGVPRTVKAAKPGGRGPQDMKTYVLHPVNLSLETHSIVYQAFNESMYQETAIKMDILAAIRYMDTFLKQWLAGQLHDARWDEKPGNYVGSLTTAFYKDMGNAKALLNLSEISLPKWMPVENLEQGRHYQDVLKEHQQIVNSLDERYADQYNLLVSYRDFLSGQNLDMFFKFCGAYTTVLMSLIEQRKRAPQFSTTNLEVIIVSHDRKLKPIIESPGFQNIAKAIRRSTVSPQFQKTKGQKGLYDVRYGLGTDLLRMAAYPNRFIQALGEFMHAFNQENARIYERESGEPRVRRANITTEDIADIVSLIDDYGSQTVGNLLVAYGYAREPRAQGAEDLATESTEVDNSANINAI